MDKRLETLNIVYAVVDTIISALAITAFGAGAYFFEKWWILTFTIVPLILFNNHTLVIEQDIRDAKVDNLNNGEVNEDDG